MFWIALELSIPKMGLKSMLSLTVKKLDAFKFDGVVESDNTECENQRVAFSRKFWKKKKTSLPAFGTLKYFNFRGDLSFEYRVSLK